jgi:type II secretory pathway pseudopilin PulG
VKTCSIADLWRPSRRTERAEVRALSTRRCSPAKTHVQHDEAGAILILALVFLLVVAVVVASLASWTMNNLNNTLQFQQAGSRLYAAEGATQVAIRASRYTYPPNNSDGTGYTSGTSYACPGESPIGSVNGIYVQVWCVTKLMKSTKPTITREVTLTACQVPSSSGVGIVCSGGAVLLTALIYIDDFDPTTHLNTGCVSPANESTCGSSMSTVSWVPGL